MVKKNYLKLGLGFFLCSSLLSVHAQTQQATPFNAQQLEKIEQLKQDYLGKGFSESFAQSRAEVVVSNENKVQLRSRLTPPPAGSILVDRDTSNLSSTTAYHPVYHAYTPEQMVKKVLLSDSRAESAITNVQFKGHNWAAGAWTGDDRSLHYFQNGSGIQIEKGLLLATGPALQAEGNNSSGGGMSGGTSVTGDPDLSSICTAVTSGSILEFDFTPFASKVTFDFIFASEEYGNYSNSHSVNDAFGFFVSKVGVPGSTINIAKFPNDSAVTISNSNWGWRGCETAACYTANPPDTTGYSAALAWDAGQQGFYVPSSSTIAVNPQWHIPHPVGVGGSVAMEYDGQTVKLQAIADNLVVGDVYHLKLAISNKGDNALGSAVFLSNLDLGIPTSIIDKGKPENPYNWDTSFDVLGQENLYCNCTQRLSLEFQKAVMDRNVVLEYVGIAKDHVALPNGKSLPDTIKLAAGDSLVRLDFQTLEVPSSLEGQQGAIIARIVGGGSDTTDFFYFYNRPVTKVDYIRPTAGYSGLLNLNLKGGSPQMLRSINGGLTWVNAHLPFTKAEIANIDMEGTVVLKEPNSCFFVTIPLSKSEAGTDVIRQIDIPKITGAATIPAAGIHYTPSRRDYVFTIKPDAENANRVPVVTTSRTIVPDSEGVQIQKNPDGTYTVRIVYVQEPMQLSISFKENPTGNMEFDENQIWANDGFLYIKSTEATESRIYNAQGKLIQSVVLGANQTESLTLPAGLYIIKLNNSKTYKVLVP